MQLIGRTKERNTLQHVMDSDKPEFVAIHGRRRVGKTFLVKEFFKDKAVLFFNVTGQKDGKLAIQLRHKGACTIGSLKEFS